MGRRRSYAPINVFLNGRMIRLPQEDMCQALSIPPTQKYQREGGPGITQIMDVLRGSDEPNQDRIYELSGGVGECIPPQKEKGWLAPAQKYIFPRTGGANSGLFL